MPFPKGVSGNPGGRPKGRQNNATLEIRALAQSLFDKDYWTRTREKLKAGTLHPSIEARLLAYAYGEPKQDHASGKLVVNLGFLQLPADVISDDQNTIDTTAQDMTLQTRR